MDDRTINDLRLKYGTKAEAYSDCTRVVIVDGQLERHCFIMLTTDENDPSKAVYLEIGPTILKRIINNLTDDLNCILVSMENEA